MSLVQNLLSENQDFSKENSKFPDLLGTEVSVHDSAREEWRV